MAKMVSRKAIPLFFCFFALQKLCESQSDLETVTRPPDMPCKAAVSLLLKTQMKGITACSKSMKFKSGKDKAAKMTCILKCVLINEGVVTKDGLLTAEQTDIFCNTRIPANLYDKASPILRRCFDLSVGKVDPNEEFCKSYDPFIKCVLDAVPKFCEQ